MKPVRSRVQFVCQSCGHQTPRWAGRCPDCGQWNSLREEVSQREERGRPKAVSGGPAAATPIDQIEGTDEMRLETGLGELDRVLGGGVVPGSVILVGGDPGIGKTTLLLQALEQLGHGAEALLYVSGEESPRQIKMRGDRLGVHHSQLYVLAETSFEEILKAAQQLKPAALVVDSIQTVYTDQVSSAPGSVSQVQEVACQLMWYAKRSAVPVFIIGHVTKEGVIAGPRLLEHIVDTVLYFEGDKSHAFRILRAVKNRFGATNEIGVFEMKDSGLEEVANPSELFLAGRPERSTGSVVVSSLEGSRPILVELQALVTATGYAMPKRMANGVELNRMSLLLAVMEKRSGFHLSGQDVYVNVVGGLRVDEPSIDLGIVAAVASSLREQPIDSRTLVMGEVGLGGEVRPVNQVEIRLKEAMKLGFRRCVLPERNIEKCPPIEGMEMIGVQEITQMFDQVLAYV
ncbi:MAG: DNA repair protein RadA [Nitrospirales bacterium]|nr:DNA repair protein RadA [Nitrospirales bacterium]